MNASADAADVLRVTKWSRYLEARQRCAHAVGTASGCLLRLNFQRWGRQKASTGDSGATESYAAWEPAWPRRSALVPDTIVRQHTSAIQDATLKQVQIQPTTDLRKERHSGPEENGMNIEAHLIDHTGLE